MSLPSKPWVPEAELSMQQAQLQIRELRAELAKQIDAKVRLQESLDLRNAALDAASTHFLIVDARQKDRPIVYANRAVAENHGYASAHELIGKSVNTLLGVAIDDEKIQEARALLAEGRTARSEMEITRPDGSKFWVGFSSTPLFNEFGENTHHVSLGADITARREAARRQAELHDQLLREMKERERISLELRVAQKLESVGRLAAGLAHEINTPIQYVGDSVHFLRSAFDDLAKLFHSYRNALISISSGESASARLVELRELEVASDFEFLSMEVPKAFERTLEGTDRVAGIVRAMKEFAHPDTGEHMPADLNRALATTLTVACNEYKYAATIVTDFGELPAVTCNIGELNQVFLNLIVNAAHAIQDAGRDSASGRIGVLTRVKDGCAEVEITDNGCGISAENMDNIFDPFFTTKEVGRGTGQGLAIARTIVVDKHGGVIDVHSEVGAGTRFIIRLLLRESKLQAVA